jgi:hypothetical protein
MEPIRAVHAISAGLQLALSEMYGLDLRPLELTAVMHLLLDDEAGQTEQTGQVGQPGQSRVDAWLAGHASFEAAVRVGAETDPALRALSGSLGADPV